MSEKVSKGTKERIEKALDELGRPVLIQLVVGFFKAIFFIYSIISYIPYKIFADPDKKLRLSRRIKAVPTVPGDPSSPWRSVHALDHQLENTVYGCDTLGAMWDECVKHFGDSDCLGTREVIAVFKEKQKSGKIFEKMVLGDYHFRSFNQVDEEVTFVAKGLLELELRRGEHVVFFAETRQEWLISALACFKCKFPIVTVYPTLGHEAIVYAINDCDGTTIFTTAALLPKLAKAIGSCPKIKRVIYFPSVDPVAEDVLPDELTSSEARVLHYSDVLELGSTSEHALDADPPKPDDLAIIMYTSGTTGSPKGVMLSNKNMTASLAGLTAFYPISPADTYIGYLPLTHMFEICAELVAIIKGCRIGYSTAQTLIDSAPKIQKGQLGDCRVLKPTLICFVPAILDRIFKAVVDDVSRRSPLMIEIFRACYERKRDRYLAGYTSSLLNYVAFNNIPKMLGGRIHLMVSGGAPLSEQTARFTTVVFSCPLVQGYALTETCAGGTFGDINDLTSGNVGPPIVCCEIMLREWSEAGYFPTNERPQGEILISGENVALGYYKNPEKTNEAFFEIDGKRWFASGDIGEFREDGCLRIIDRKKDLIKLAQGEYISFGKVETVLGMNSLVDNICVYGDGNRNFIIAFIVANHKNLKSLAEKIGITDVKVEDLCKDKRVVQEALNELQNFAKARLERMEIPQRIVLCAQPWTPASGLLTEAMKVKRRAIAEHYETEIHKAYES